MSNACSAADAMANAYTQRGIALLNENTAASLAEAITWFERAIELRRPLPLQENPWFRYGLIAGWMNCADALTRLGSVESLAQALLCHQTAFEHLQLLPIEQHPLFKRRLAIAWLNRGITLRAQATPASLAEAVHSFDQTIAVLGRTAAGIEDYGPLLGAAWTNRGGTLLQVSPPQFEPALIAAAQGLRCVASSQENDLLSAELSFKASHILCQAAAHHLTSTNLGEGIREALIFQATEAVDSAMLLGRHWERQGVTQFRPLLNELFRFGALLYQTCQPHFLSEFLLENLDPDRSPGAMTDSGPMHGCAMEAMSRAVCEVHQDGFKSIHTPGFARVLELLGDLRQTESRLVELAREDKD